MIGSTPLDGRFRCALPVLLAAFLSFGWVSRARAADPEPPSKDFLEYLGTIEAEGDDWTLFDPKQAPTDQPDPPSPPKKETPPTKPQPGKEP